MPRENADANRSNQLLHPLLPQYSRMPPADDTHTNADEVVENANNWQLSKNTIYRNLQKALARRTHERDMYRKAYLKVIKILGPEIFDDVPDEFGIRDAVVKVQQAKKWVKEKLEDI